MLRCALGIIVNISYSNHIWIEIEKKLLQLYAKEKEYLLHQMFI